LCDVNKISYNLLIQIQDIISNNSECLCPIDNITTSDLDSLLDNLNKLLSEDKKKDRKKRELPNFRDIKEFIGITVNNKDYFSKPIPSGLKNDQLCDRQIITSKSSLADLELDTDDTPTFYKPPVDLFNFIRGPRGGRRTRKSRRRRGGKKSSRKGRKSRKIRRRP
jgi:hypothetical protein